MKRFSICALIIAVFLGVTFTRARTAESINGNVRVTSSGVEISYQPHGIGSMVVIKKISPALGYKSITLISTVSTGKMIMAIIPSSPPVDYVLRHRLDDTYIVTETDTNGNTITGELQIENASVYLPVISGGSSFGQ